jgi:hypothetical protein
MMLAVLRVIIAVGGGWFAVAMLGAGTPLFAVFAAAFVIYGFANVAAVVSGTRFKGRKLVPNVATLTT